MDLVDFTDALAHMTIEDLHEVAARLSARHSCVAGDLAWWEATVDIDRALKTLHRRRQAAMAALDAGRAVQTAAWSAGLQTPDADVTRVARAAADVARGLSAAPMADHAVELLLDSFVPVLPATVGS